MTERVWNSFTFFLNAAATNQIYTLSLHDALPISQRCREDRRLAHRARLHLRRHRPCRRRRLPLPDRPRRLHDQDRKSTRPNSSHTVTSYAVFCLKKKTPTATTTAPASRLQVRSSP